MNYCEFGRVITLSLVTVLLFTTLSFVTPIAVAWHEAVGHRIAIGDVRNLVWTTTDELDLILIFRSDGTAGPDQPRDDDLAPSGLYKGSRHYGFKQFQLDQGQLTSSTIARGGVGQLTFSTIARDGVWYSFRGKLEWEHDTKFGPIPYIEGTLTVHRNGRAPHSMRVVFSAVGNG